MLVARAPHVSMLNQAAVQAFKAKVWGQVFTPADGPAFHDSIKLWAKPIRPIQPAVVVQPRGVPDIQAALAFAREQGLEVAVKGGGHSPSNLCLLEDGLVIDMSCMRGVFVDPKAKTAVAEGGCHLGDIDKATSVYNLAVPLGHAPWTGMGLALNGGMGVLKQVYGATAQHILGATLVLADGRVVHANADEDPELLWGIQGAGSALGVAANITFKLHDVSSAYAGFLQIPDDPEHKNLRAVVRFMKKAREEPGYSNNCIRGLGGPVGQGVINIMLCYLGPKSVEEKAAFIAPLRALGPIRDTVGQDHYVDMQFSTLPRMRVFPEHYEYWTSGQFSASQLDDAFLDTWCKLIDEMPSGCKELSAVTLSMWRSPPGVNPGHAVEEDENTGPHGLLAPGAELGWGLIACYLDASEFDEVKAYARKMKSDLSSLGGTDVYVNLSTMDEDAEGQLASRVGGPEKLTRLRALKARVDPDNVFKSHPFKGL